MRQPSVPLASSLENEGSSHSRGPALEPAGFVDDLERELLRALARLGEQARVAMSPSVPVTDLLAAALRDEIETAEIAALWLTDEPDLDLRLGFARQVGDEARHFERIAERIRELGADPTADPRTRAHSPVFRYLRGLQTPAERLAAGLVREAVARLKNALLAQVCEAMGDTDTARLCRDEVGPDEMRHLEFCRKELPRYALTLTDQEAARRAVARTLQLAEEATDSSRAAKATSATPADPSPGGR
jgi:bacterioferritin (cytochrome b1)